jgi:prevent-host-death family protein
MEQLTTRDLRNRSAQALRRVQEEGTHFTVTSHGRPIAALVPIPDAPAAVRWTPIAQYRARLHGADAGLRDDLTHLREQTTDDLRH